MTKAEVLAAIDDHTGTTLDGSERIDSLGIDSLEYLDLLLGLERASGKSLDRGLAFSIETTGELAERFA